MDATSGSADALDKRRLRGSASSEVVITQCYQLAMNLCRESPAAAAVVYEKTIKLLVSSGCVVPIECEEIDDPRELIDQMDRTQV